MDRTKLETEDPEERLGALTRFEAFRLFVNGLHAALPRLLLPAVSAQRATVMPQLARIKAAPMKAVLPRTTRTTLDGYTRVEPAGVAWCAAAGLTKDEGALARMVASETGALPPQYLLAVAEAACNEAQAKGLSPFQKITNDRRAFAAGYFGRQSGRWCASVQDPTQRHLEAARIALSDHPRVARDARRWVDGKVMDHGKQGGKALAYNAVTLVEKWGKEGWEWIGHVYEDDGLTVLFDPYLLMLFRFVGRGAKVAPGVAAMQDGRRRWHVVL